AVVLDLEPNTACVGQYQTGLHDLVALEIEASVGPIQMLVEGTNLLASVHRLPAFRAGPGGSCLTEEQVREGQRFPLSVHPNEDVHHSIDVLDRLDERADRAANVDDFVQPTKRCHRPLVVTNPKC